ncbi:hypothetical protein [Burkholderia sp. F1]|uniref:hypothetical protein n=1 Tax=Burkholderia sp. F1 TaxID=3366817 RepID=UPI003D709788
MKSILTFPLFFLAAVAIWLAWSLLYWPVLLGLQALTTHLFIPHPAGSYIGLGFVSAARLTDFPTSFVSACSVPFMNLPLGFIATFWWLGVAIIVPSAYRRYRVVARSARASRAVLLGAARSLLTMTAVFLVVATPFLRRYEIVSQDHLYVRHLFDWHERAYPLASLKAITVQMPENGRGPITWDFAFNAGDRFSTTAPDIDALKYLLSKVRVSTNFSISGSGIVLR